MIGERLHQRISELGLTQQRAADQLEISQSRLNQYLKNKREPDAQMFCRICRTFGVSPNWLYGFEENTPAELPKIDKTALESAVLFLKNTKKVIINRFQPARLPVLLPLYTILSYRNRRTMLKKQLNG